jgi:hypothetical protein
VSGGGSRHYEETRRRHSAHYRCMRWMAKKVSAAANELLQRGLRCYDGNLHGEQSGVRHGELSYPVFMLKSSTHRMHDPGSIVSHIRPKSVHR